MKTKEECYQQASFESLAESSTETRQDVIYRAMEIYANEKLANFISSNPMLADSLPIAFAEWLLKNNMIPNGFGGWGGGYLNVNYYGSKTKDLYKLFLSEQGNG